MATLLTAPFTQIEDGNGNPLSGGKIYTYVTGASLTPKATYTDSGAGTPLSNPVILDSNGAAQIWLSGAYRMRIFSAADVLLYDVDNVSSDASSTTSFTDSTFEIVDNLDATKKIQFQLSSLTTATTRTYTAPDKSGTLALTSDIGGAVSGFQVTDTTDIALSVAPTQANVGSTKSITIPTKGYICLIPNLTLAYVGAADRLVLGIRIGSTNYWPTAAGGAYVSSAYPTTNPALFTGVGATTIAPGSGNDFGAFPVYIPIEAMSIPTGTQTVQVIASKYGSAGTSTIKGTSTTTRIGIIVFDQNA